MSEMPCSGWLGTQSGLCRHRAEEFREIFFGKALLGEQTETIDGTQGLRSRRSTLENKILKLLEALCTWHLYKVLVPCLLQLLKRKAGVGLTPGFLLTARNSSVRVYRRACRQRKFGWMQRIWRTSGSINEMVSLHGKVTREAMAGLRLLGLPAPTPGWHAACGGVV